MVQNKSRLGTKRLFFSDFPSNSVWQCGVHLFFWTSFRPLKVGSKWLLIRFFHTHQNYKNALKTVYVWGKVYYIYLDFFLVFLVQNDEIWWKMNKKDKIKARKAIFDVHKVFIICNFIYSNMVINYDKFKFFTSKYRK